MTDKKIAAVTHVRHDEYFLDHWIRHYAQRIGGENCFVLLDGSDWVPTPAIDLVNSRVIERPRKNMNRVRIDRRMVRFQLDLIDELFFEKGYEFVIRGDCDEYVIHDPLKVQDFSEIFDEIGSLGYLFSSGIDVIQNLRVEGPVDLNKSLMHQRDFGLIYQSYFKVNLLSRRFREQGFTYNAGGHRTCKGSGVAIAENSAMLHLGWADKKMIEERSETRFAFDPDNSFGDYISKRLEIYSVFAEVEEFADYDTSMPIARREYIYRNGVRALGPQKLQSGNFYWNDRHGWAVKIPSRFKDLV
ncbi:MAG: hypothetical protein AAF755_06920 [Pseudomonadota bacterium]